MPRAAEGPHGAVRGPREIVEEASEGGLPQSIQSHGGLLRQSGRLSRLPTAFPGDLLPLARGSISQEIFGGCIPGPWLPLPAVEVRVLGLVSVYAEG